MFYDILLYFFFSFVSVARLCQWSMYLDSFFFLFCVCGLVWPILYASLFIFYLFSVVAKYLFFLQCSMPLYLYFFLSFVSVSWLCQCSMPLIMYFFFLFCLCLGFAKGLCLYI